MVQVLIDSLRRGRGTRSKGRTARGRHRGSGVGWMEDKVFGSLCGGIELNVKVLGGWSILYNVE